MFHITQIGVVLLTLTCLACCTWIICSAKAVHKARAVDHGLVRVYRAVVGPITAKAGAAARVVWFSFAGAFQLTLAYFGSRLIQRVMVRSASPAPNSPSL